MDLFKANEMNIDKKIDQMVDEERVQELEEQNKRYKKALEKIARGRFPGASYKARKALEDEE